MTDQSTCRTCATPIPEPIRGHAHRRGFCSNKCNVAYRPVLFTVLCANHTCQRGEGGGRRIFTTYKSNAECCCRPCQNTHWQRSKSWRKPLSDVVTTPLAPTDLDTRPVWGDLSAERIESLLAATAARRKATKSWLRITEPYAQRAGSALHQQALVTHSLDTEGAYL